MEREGLRASQTRPPEAGGTQSGRADGGGAGVRTVARSRPDSLPLRRGWGTEKAGGGLQGTLRGYSCVQDRWTMVWLLRCVGKETASWAKHRKE